MDSGLVAAAAKTGAKPTLEAGDDAFYLPTLPEFLLRKLLLHLAPIGRLRKCLGTAPIIDGDDGVCDAKLFPTKAVVPFAVICGVGVEGLNLDVLRPLAHYRRKVRRIVARAGSHASPGDQVRWVVAKDGELWVAAIAFHPAATPQEMPTDVAALKPCGVQGSIPVEAQAELARPLEHCVEQRLESPLFSRRCWAFCSVVKCGTFFSPRMARRSLKSCRSWTMPR